MDSNVQVEELQLDTNAVVPDSWDWREHKAVTGVKNQGRCGSCWSFAATGALEGAHAIKKGNLVSFSEQVLVDCLYQPRSGCSGGNAVGAMNYFKEHYIFAES